MENNIYLAGLTDGDGSIDLEWKGKSRKFVPRIRFMMHINTSLKDFFLKEGFNNYHHPSGKAETFIKEGELAIETVKRIMPYLILKKEKAKLLIEAWDIMPRRYGVYTKEIVDKLTDFRDEMRKHNIRQCQSIFKWDKEAITKCFNFD